MPKVSVIMPSYNHERFIAEAIDSVLMQTAADLEIVVVDDGSRDNSNTIIAGVADTRLRHIPLPQNVGACAAMNIALDAARGAYIAVCNSDDIWETDKLERQVALLDAMPDVAAVFTDATWIDDDGRAFKDEALPPYYAEVFAQPNRSRYGWIRRLVEEGNCLCHPSVLIRREVYDAVGVYDNMLRQLPDLDMWLRVVQSYEIHVMRDKLIRFRLHASNTSRPSSANAARTWVEHRLIVKRFFDEVSPANFYRAFGASDLDAFEEDDPLGFDREKILYLTRTTCAMSEVLRTIGVDAAYRWWLDHDEPIIDAMAFHALTERSAEGRGAVAMAVQPAAPRPLGKRMLRAMLGREMYERLHLLKKWATDDRPS